MDQLLVFSTLQKPDPEERIDIDYYVVRVSFNFPVMTSILE